MPIEIIRNDIAKMTVDAIVNAANTTLLGGGGVDGMIHRAAGPRLLDECRTLGGCVTGDAKITGAYDLPCKYVIHTVGPVWAGGSAGEEALLRSCYERSLALAAAHRCETVAFPLISAGAYGYPRDQALRVAMDTISNFLLEHEMTVYLVVFDKASFAISEKLHANIAQYIDDCYAEMNGDFRFGNRPRPDADFSSTGSYAPISGDSYSDSWFEFDDRISTEFDEEYHAHDFEDLLAKAHPQATAPQEFAPKSASSMSLEDMLRQLDESFTQMVLRKIDEKGIKDSECYTKANMDRRLFSKIRSNVHYQPTKRTAVALAIGLELSLEETRSLLSKAGFALSHANEFDIIIEYFIIHGKYNIHEINQALFAFDQQTLGV